MSPYQVIDKAEKGISATLFEKLAKKSGYSKASIAGFLGLDVRTISNYKSQNKNFTRTDAEHLLKLKELFEKGIEVFGTSEEFARWLSKPAYGLEGRVPEKLLHYISGIELVRRELIRIEYGDFS
ncbi:MAG: antitoxin Xre/MbcA/ParS toxin-binding domain-containing protein [Cyclobacteriaceae bacterium]